MAKKETIKMLETDLHTQKVIAEVSNSQGGKLLIKTLVQEIISAVQTISDKHSTLTMQEFVALGAKIKVRNDLLQVLLKAEGNRDYYKQLLEEELKNQE